MHVCRRITSTPLPSTRSLWKLFGHKRVVDYDMKQYDNNEVMIYNEDLTPALMGRPRLTELSLKGIAKYMMTAQCQNILVLSGPLISSAAGIPDYKQYGGIEARKLMGEEGYMEKRDAKVFLERDEFHIHPYGMMRLCQALWPGNYRPTMAHYFIKTLQEKGLLLRNWTENLDNLEKLAGIRDDKLVEHSGTLLRWKCNNDTCQSVHDLLWLKDIIERRQFPNCSKCHAKCSPDLPFIQDECTTLHYQASVDAANCDLLIIIGSELMASPFCTIPAMVPWDVPRLVISEYEGIEEDDDIIDTNVNFDFDSDEAYRDVFWQGSADLAVLSLSSYLGWDRDVKFMMESDTAILKGRKEMQERLGLFRDNKEPLQKLR